MENAEFMLPRYTKASLTNLIAEYDDFLRSKGLHDHRGEKKKAFDTSGSGEPEAPNLNAYELERAHNIERNNVRLQQLLPLLVSPTPSNPPLTPQGPTTKAPPSQPTHPPLRVKLRERPQSQAEGVMAERALTHRR